MIEVECGCCGWEGNLIGMDKQGLKDCKCPGCDTIGALEPAKG